MIATAFLTLLGVYFAIGITFAFAFAATGVQRIDSHAARGSLGFRLLIIPGSTALWPLLLRRWMRDVHTPPEERNAHRRAAQKPTP